MKTEFAVRENITRQKMAVSAVEKPKRKTRSTREKMLYRRRRIATATVGSLALVGAYVVGERAVSETTDAVRDVAAGVVHAGDSTLDAAKKKISGWLRERRGDEDCVPAGIGEIGKDTPRLWNIAEQRFPESDPRDIVACTVQETGIDPHVLQNKQKITLFRPK
jgi:hypothetical protein